MAAAQVYYILLSFFLVAFNGFFVGAEFALVKARKTRLQELAEQGNGFARMALWEHEHLDTYLSTTQVGITIASLGLGALGEPAYARIIEPVFARWGGMGVAAANAVAIIAAFLLISFLEVVFGELTPKTLAIFKPEGLAMAVAWPLRIFFLVFYPVIWVLNRSANLVVRTLGMKPAGEHVTSHTEEEILMILTESARGGSLRDSEVLLVERSFDFADTAVHAVMVPRVDIDFLSLEWDTPRIVEELTAHPHNRYPIVEEEDLDRIRGFVNLKELLPQVARGEIRLNETLRELHTVPESHSVERLLRDLQTRRTKIALVMDEYGGTAGMVTIEDLVEELVGELTDEMDREPPDIDRREDGFILQGLAALTDVSRELSEDLESEHFDTIGGWIMGTLERIPREGDQVESPRHSFRVLRMEGPRVMEVKVEPRPADESSDSPETN